MRKGSIVLTASSVLPAFNARMMMTVFSPCPSPAMKCVATTNAAIVFAFAACFACAAASFAAMKNKRTVAIVLTGMALLATVLGMLMPSIMGGCMKADMRCRVYTFPYLYVASGVVAVLLLIAGFLCGKRGNDESR